jgi:hypothetical protein
MWTQAEEAAHCVQTGMRAAPVVLGALIHVLTRVVVCCQAGARDTITTALVAAWQVVARVLAGAMSVS